MTLIKTATKPKQKPGRKSEAERAEARAAALIATRQEAEQQRKIDLYERQEAKRAPQFQIDQKPTLILLMILTGITFVATAVLTADGTIGAAAAAEFITTEMAFVLFGAYEVAILAFMMFYYMIGSRTDYDGNPIPAGHWFVAMVVASTMTALLSVYHVLDIYNYAWTEIDMWVGVAIRLSVSVFFVVVSKGAASALFARAVRL